jgi:hypothetical protein
MGLSLVPWLAVVLMQAATASLMTRPPNQAPLSWIADGLRRRWRALAAVFTLPVVVTIVAVVALLVIGSATVEPGSTIRNPDVALASALLLFVSTAVLVVGALYLEVRWSITVPVLMMDGEGLREAVSRSANLTHGRRLRVALLLLAAATIIGLAVAPACVGTTLLIFGGDISPPVFGLIAGVFLCGRVIAAPVLPLTLVALREELVRLQGT